MPLVLSHADLLAQAEVATQAVCSQLCEIIGLHLRYYGDQTKSPQRTWHVDIEAVSCCTCDPGQPCGTCSLSSGAPGRRVRTTSLQNDTGIPVTQPLASVISAGQLSVLAAPQWTARWDLL
ncbi:MAG: hypothetical protein U0572_18640 [Phycisphaerales bacterium]